MYSEELLNYIKERNYYLGGDDLIFITNTKEHPQITYIGQSNNFYTITTNDSFCFNFKAMPYKEAKKRKLIKNKT